MTHPQTLTEAPSETPTTESDLVSDALVSDLLVEEVSIDGMCGVY